MTNREEELLELIRKNPSISQNELAQLLGITRSSVAVHITNLTKKGYILGKGYILRKDDHACVLGGSNMDIIGFPNGVLIMEDSNPGQVQASLGGVGRNIAENLVHLGIPTKLISAVGDDIYGRKILDHAGSIGLDMKHSLVLSNKPTSTYLAILDEDRDMKAAISQMDIYNEIIIDYVVSNYKNTEFFLDTVSSAKAMKVKEKIGSFHTIKPNRIEAELLSGIRIESREDMLRASDYFLNQGVKQVFITLGEGGVFYNNGKKHQLVPSPKVQVVNATGAGDAFVAALTFCRMKDYEIEEAVHFSMAASILALSHEETINPNISEEKVFQKMKEAGLC